MEYSDFMEFLSNSLFYPSAAKDGTAIRLFGKKVQNFVYVDYGMREERLLSELENFKGYRLACKPEKLDWRRYIEEQSEVRGFDVLGHIKRIFGRYGYSENNKHDDYKDFAFWMYEDGKDKEAQTIEPYVYLLTYERLPEFGEEHGPVSFRLLYVCAEALATYYVLYYINGIAPQYITIKRPGTGFGGNWTDFTSDGPLQRLITKSNISLIKGVYMWDERGNWPLEWSNLTRHPSIDVHVFAGYVFK